MSAVRIDTVVVGGGQAGLAVGYYLKKRGQDFVILDAEDRVGDVWRSRWNSLRLFTPAALSGLPGMPMPYPGGYFPTKDQTADYLEDYATRFDLPVRLGRHVDSVRHEGGGYLVSVGEEQYHAENVVVATGPYHTPRIPDFASRLDPSTAQLHSSDYHSPEQLPERDVLVVGAGNSGAEISVEVAATRRTYLSGRDTGKVPGDVPKTRLPWHLLLLWRIAWWLLGRVTADTRLGRKGREFNRNRGAPLVRFGPEGFTRAGVERVPRVEGVAEGKSLLADGRVLDVRSVVWATGFKPDFGWIELPVFGDDGYPIQHRGVVGAAPGLYFLGLPFQHTFASAVIGGVGKDARYVADHITRQTYSHRKGGVIRMVADPTARRFVEKLEAHHSPERREEYRRHFKTGEGGYGEGDEFIGVRMGQVFALAKEFIDMQPAEIERLLDSRVHEVRVGALSIMDKQGRRKRTPEGRRKELFDLYLRRADRINNWGLVDLGAPYVVGRYLFDKPRGVLYELARSGSVWERRTAIVATSYFIRQGDPSETFAVARMLLGDGHDLIHKAVGGWLREAGKKDRGRLLGFLDEHAAAMPRTMLRYATEHLDKDQQAHYRSTKGRNAKP